MFFQLFYQAQVDGQARKRRIMVVSLIPNLWYLSKLSIFHPAFMGEVVYAILY